MKSFARFSVVFALCLTTLCFSSGVCSQPQGADSKENHETTADKKKREKKAAEEKRILEEEEKRSYNRCSVNLECRQQRVRESLTIFAGSDPQRYQEIKHLLDLIEATQPELLPDTYDALEMGWPVTSCSEEKIQHWLANPETRLSCPYRINPAQKHLALEIYHSSMVPAFEKSYQDRLSNLSELQSERILVSLSINNLEVRNHIKQFSGYLASYPGGTYDDFIIANPAPQYSASYWIIIRGAFKIGVKAFTAGEVAFEAVKEMARKELEAEKARQEKAQKEYERIQGEVGGSDKPKHDTTQPGVERAIDRIEGNQANGVIDT